MILIMTALLFKTSKRGGTSPRPTVLSAYAEPRLSDLALMPSLMFTGDIKI